MGNGGSGLAARTLTDLQKGLKDGSIAPGEAFSDHAAEALQGAIAALGGGQGDQIADLAVVDGVFYAVGEHRIAVRRIEGDVEFQTLAHLLLGVGNAMVGVDRKAPDLDLG